MIKTLVVNTYAGSLILGARALPDAEIIGSFEDVGYGSAMPKANFPHLRFVDHVRDWPDEDLSDVIVLAHPPCAAFSQQNISASKRGVNTAAFDCTRKVMRYCFGNGCAALAVESVVGAMAGGWDVHDHFAEAGGYHVYRVLKNSILLGVPQYRERFWIVFVRKDLADPRMVWVLSPRLVTIQHCFDELRRAGCGDVPVRGLARSVDKQVARVVKESGLSEDDARAALNPSLTYRRTSYARILQARHFPDMTHHQVCKKYVSAFSSAQPSFLAPGGWAPVLLGSSLWLYGGVTASEEQYKSVMGFPPDYVFPEKERPHLRTYLSKGVCPPVATWILDNVAGHLGYQHRQSEFTRADRAFVKACAPGHVVSFRPGKQALLWYYESMWRRGVTWDDELPALRRDEEDITT
jgi:site-specific DNA-cytosine methylase